MQTHVAYLLQQLESALTVPFCSPIQQHVSESTPRGLFLHAVRARALRQQGGTP